MRWSSSPRRLVSQSDRSTYSEGKRASLATKLGIDDNIRPHASHHRTSLCSKDTSVPPIPYAKETLVLWVRQLVPAAPQVVTVTLVGASHATATPQALVRARIRRPCVLSGGTQEARWGVRSAERSGRRRHGVLRDALCVAMAQFGGERVLGQATHVELPSVALGELELQCLTN
jgi:hypothetical protein